MKIDPAGLNHEIQANLQRGVVFAGGNIEVPMDPLFPIEARVVDRAVAKRRAEFVAGRTYARRALGMIGIAPIAIPADERRAPIWPPGIVGSITHCKKYCAAIVAPSSVFAGIGLDAESDEPLPSEIVREVCSTLELRAADPPDVDLPKAIFCIKESVYKAYYPLARTFLEFSDVAVKIYRDGAFTARLTRETLPAADGLRTFTGRYVNAGGLVAAWTLLLKR